MKFITGFILFIGIVSLSGCKSDVTICAKSNTEMHEVDGTTQYYVPCEDSSSSQTKEK